MKSRTAATVAAIFALALSLAAATGAAPQGAQPAVRPAGMPVLPAAKTAAQRAARPAGMPVLPATKTAAHLAARPAPKGLANGIQVHGRWTIIVRNPDGSIAAKREFENNLMLSGEDLIPAILAGTTVPGGWVVELASDASTEGPCGDVSSGVMTNQAGGTASLEGACEMVEPSALYEGGAGCSSVLFPEGCSPTLAVSVVTGPGVNGAPGGFALQLTGTATATLPPLTTGYLNNVSTYLAWCGSVAATPAGSARTGSSVSPDTCISTGPNPDYIFSSPVVGGIEPFFTAASLPAAPTATLPAAINVVNGQTIQVTVLISFS